MDGLLAPFAPDFMQRAFLAAIVVGALCSALGTYVVLRKLSFIGDGLAHASFAGIVIAYLRGGSFWIGATIATVVTALGIGFVHRRARVSLDTAIGVLFTGAFALGIFLMSRSTRATLDLQSFLFGNILGVSSGDLLNVLVLGLIVAFVVGALWRPLLYTSFDPVVAQAAGIREQFVDDALLVILALTIIVSLQLVGIVLVAALLVTPAAAAAQLTRRFVPMMLLSIGFGVTATVGGLYASYQLRAASGATIVLLATLIFFGALAVSAARRRPFSSSSSASSR
ncbi:membrane protein [Vulcanimicrobium alpinum]|uniref:Membrane protein n=1 Tax=Vulcanimicrobium alpinum TaxID=3016050 RepID=A0AAN1XVT6_UNVUL|nr:metal ABC transporter permease [Vulcanimicrobium alpinum]BDE05212.1 membrane protein [Vulcanimicrobium alpinum]